ncbi:MAG: hypothetical protein V1913_09945 [Fibrobacterota bacterium]
MKKKSLIPVSVLLLPAAAGLVYYFMFMKNLNDRIVIPYISHQKPRIDPHVPGAVPLSSKLDEVLFDGLFNVSANKSGIVYEDGLGEFMGIDNNAVVSVRLKANRKWHSSWAVSMEKKKITVTPREAALFTAKDLKFTLRRIQSLGSLSPDYILVSQAVKDFDFSGPDENGEIKLQFGRDRIWSEGDIKEVLSFKVLPGTSEMNAAEYTVGTGPFPKAGEFEENLFFKKMPEGIANIGNVILRPFIDNSTFTTELRNGNINVLLTTPCGSVSPILGDSLRFFCKSNISNTFFALFYNTERLDLARRQALRRLIDNKKILSRFFKMGTAQQRHVINYKGANDNYGDYLNFSVFPASSYYVEEKIVTPLNDSLPADLSLFTDTLRIKTCTNNDYREELSELVAILNDPTVGMGKIRATAVSNDEIARGEYDAVLVPVSGYRSNFLFDLYTVFLREPDFNASRINLQTQLNPATGEKGVDNRSFTSDKNFFRLDLSRQDAQFESIKKLLDCIYGFMSTSEIGDKQAYAQQIDLLEQELALGSWLFSLPSLAYFSTQFNRNTVDLYGIASQLSTIEKWQETKKK